MWRYVFPKKMVDLPKFISVGHYRSTGKPQVAWTDVGQPSAVRRQAPALAECKRTQTKMTEHQLGQRRPDARAQGPVVHRQLTGGSYWPPEKR